MKKIIIIILVLILLSQTSGAKVDKSYNPETKTVTLFNDVTNKTLFTIQQYNLISDITIFKDYLNVTAYVNYTLDCSQDFLHRYQRFKGNNDISSITWQIYNNASEQYQVFSPCGSNLKNGSSYIILLTLTKEAETGDSAILSKIVMNNITIDELTWWNTSWPYRADNHIANGTRPYQISLNISNSTGTNNGTFVFCNGSCNPDFSDIRFTLDNTTELPYWLENFTTGKVWVNVTGNCTAVNMYYGNPVAAGTSNGTNTFDFFDDFSGDLSKWDYKGASISSGIVTIAYSGAPGEGNYIASKVTILRESIIEFYAKVVQPQANNGLSANSSNIIFGAQNSIWWHSSADGTLLPIYGNPTSAVGQSTANSANWITWKIIWSGSASSTKFYLDGVQKTSPTTNFPSNTALYISLGGASTSSQPSGEVDVDTIMVRKYVATEPQWATWGGKNQILNITDWGNNITNNQSLILSYSNLSEFYKVIHFNITTNHDPDIWNWTLDNVSQGVSSNSYDHTFTSNGSYYISVSVYDADSNITLYKNWTLNLTLGYFAEPNYFENIFLISDNKLINPNNWKVILNGKIESEVLIDSNNLYFFTNSTLYFINKENGSINYKIMLSGLKNIKQTSDLIYVHSDFILYRIFKVNASIDFKNIYNEKIEKVWVP